MGEQIAVIPGDGIGQEVIPPAVEVLDALGDFEFVEARAGDHLKSETGEVLPESTYETVQEADATLFGAAGEEAADIILPLREAVGSFANIRPVRAYHGVDALQPKTDVVFVRENTEGVYTGIEADIADGVTTLTRVISEDATRRIAEYGFDYAEKQDYDEITIVHKANVMRQTDGLFLDTCRKVGAERGVDYDDVYMDAFAMHLVRNPENFGVIICPNFAGDVLSDLAAGLVGGLGLLPSSNIGADNALFEPVHGSAPDIAGQGIANPIATILSTGMLLEYLNYDEKAWNLRSAVDTVLSEGPHTPDLGGEANTKEVTDAVLDRL